MTAADWLRSLPALAGQAPPRDAELPAEPHALFLTWLRQAVDAGVAEPHAVTLATIDPDGLPDARTLILKEIDARGWAFAGRRSSRKGAQLAVHPVAALDFWWQPLVRAVRVRGAVREASAEESAADLAARSAAAREGIDDWVRWWIEPHRVEFWQGSPDRHHHRTVYLRTSDGRGADGWIRSEERG